MNALGNSLKRIQDSVTPITDYIRWKANRDGRKFDKEFILETIMELRYPGEEVILTHREALIAKHTYEKDYRDLSYWLKERGGKVREHFYSTDPSHEKYRPPKEKELLKLVKYFQYTGNKAAEDAVQRDLDKF